MSGRKPLGPPKGEPWTWITRDVLGSQAWRSMTINTRRLIDFLLCEHMAHGGRENGRLMAPRRQLEQFGIGARHVSAAIEDAVALGLVDVRRGTGRKANAYALTWLPLHDGTMPEPRWRAVAASEGKSLQMTSEGKHQGYPKGSHKRVATSEGKSQEAVVTSLRQSPKGSTFLESDLTKADAVVDLSGRRGAA